LTGLPDNWQVQLQAHKAIIGDIQHNKTTGIPTVLIAIPVLSSKGNIIGFFAADLQVSSLETVLQSFINTEPAESNSTRFMLVQKDGALLVSTKSPVSAVKESIQAPNCGDISSTAVHDLLPQQPTEGLAVYKTFRSQDN